MKNFTVVICTYKRHYLIQNCLENILDNSIIPDKIIIIDQIMIFLPTIRF